MLPNLNNPSASHPASQPSHQLQPSIHPLHSHTHPPPAHTHSHLPHHHHHRHHPSTSTPLRAPLDSQEQQRANIDHYKSSAETAYTGYISNTHDALIIFSGCYRGRFPMVSRRLHERERRSITSGAVYVFDETKAGIKRWTDGRVWSPSRILNNFLVYREIDQKRPPPTTPNPSSSSTSPDQSTSTTNTTPNHQPDTPSTSSQYNNNNNNSPHNNNPPGQAAPTQTENRKSSELSSLEPNSSGIPNDDNQQAQTPPEPAENSSPSASNQPRIMNRERERSLVGSLTSTYKFRPDGLVKKTISIAGMHMISYYKLDDVVAGRLRTPTSHQSLLNVEIIGHFLNPGFFRVPPQHFISNGRIWIQEEGSTEMGPPTLGAISSVAPLLQDVPRPGARPLIVPTSTLSHPAHGIRTSHPPARPNPSDATITLSRPARSDSPPGSPDPTSPTSPNSFLLLSNTDLHNNSATAPRSPVINTHGGLSSFPLAHNTNNTASSSDSPHLARPGPTTTTSSTRYEPYPPRASRSPSISPSSPTNSTVTDYQAPVQYYGYSTHSLFSDSNSAPLVGSDQQPASNRNTRNGPSANDGRNLESSVGQVGGYDESATYRTATSTSAGSECLYSQYTLTDPANNSHRSPSDPPSSYGLPSINRLGASGQPASSSSGAGARPIGDYQYTGSPNQPQTNRLSPSTASHGGSYGGYLSPAVPDSTFRGSGGGPSLSERENHTYGSSSASANSLANPAGQASSATGTQSGSFIYPPTSSSTSSGYGFANPARRGSAMSTLPGEVNHRNADSARGGARISSQNRPNGSGLQLGERSNGASHWGQMSSSHAMKKEEDGGE